MPLQKMVKFLTFFKNSQKIEGGTNERVSGTQRNSVVVPTLRSGRFKKQFFDFGAPYRKNPSTDREILTDSKSRGKSPITLKILQKNYDTFQRYFAKHILFQFQFSPP